MGLPVETTNEELEGMFTKFGKAKCGRFRDTATIIYNDDRDAEDAARDLDGTMINGSIMHVKFVM